MSNYDSPVNELPKATKRQKIEFYFRSLEKSVKLYLHLSYAGQNSFHFDEKIRKIPIVFIHIL